MGISTDELWITTLITDIRKNHLLVTEAVSARVQELLNGQFNEQALTEVELRKVAKELIVAMATASPNGKAK